MTAATWHVRRKVTAAVKGMLAAIILLWTTPEIYSQTTPLTIETSTIQPSIALGRPMLTWLDVKIPGSGLVVGKFQFVIKTDNVTLATVETDELTLNGPEQRIRVLLPAIDSYLYIDQLFVDISFQGKKYSGNLGQQILRVPFSTKTVFMGLVGESRVTKKRSSLRDITLERLKFESIIPESRRVSRTPKGKNNSDEVELVKTIFASIDPTDFPSEAIAYCGFDLIVLLNEEFRNLRKPQLEALLTWVRAGGSLYLQPNGILEGYHVDFLRGLVEGDPNHLVIQLDQFGKLPPESLCSDREAIVIKSGLGDVAIRSTDSDRKFNTSEDDWRSIVGSLWKFRLHPAEPPSQSFYGVDINGQPRPNPDPWGFMTSRINRVSMTPTDLLDRLMPDGVQMVPLSLLSTILLAFVLLIGPGDYFGLGRLRMRKLTWITFPLATLGVTALMVWLSNIYMSGSETRRALVVRDLDSQGKIVRSNRFELLFMGSTHQVVTPVEKGLFTSLNTNMFTQQMQGTMVAPNGTLIRIPRTGLGEDGQVRSVTTQVSGRIPAQYTATQELAKWTPQVNRVFSIPGPAESPDVNWAEFDLSSQELQIIRSHVVPPQLEAKVKARFGDRAMLACFSGKDGAAYDRSTGWRSTRSRVASWSALRHQSLINETSTVAHRMSLESDLLFWLYQASVATSEFGEFALMSRTTPKGGAACDDLTLLDTSNPGDWLLVIIVPEKNDYVVYRKLMKSQN